ncbi:hypothetical protein FZEAL_7098 [Fusarium zealandicum]|uniref:Uncharacterized protein n=1 Tax=Fusarium zealandicum TaxID=1053134 RepID=A0A8H4UGI4_9HYPO|nr:hypothetical protein FZEAL_7098 [Fusarium zealandicum]
MVKSSENRRAITSQHDESSLEFQGETRRSTYLAVDAPDTTGAASASGQAKRFMSCNIPPPRDLSSRAHALSGEEGWIGCDPRIKVARKDISGQAKEKGRIVWGMEDGRHDARHALKRMDEWNVLCEVGIELCTNRDTAAMGC